jgi:hypothetical protein
MWAWIKKHPQRLAGLLLSVFGSVQGGLALFQQAMPPLVSAGVNMAMGALIAALAWAHKNLKDEP